jgi:threonine/homoserine/homoserine lactone efflux protein
MISSHGYLLYCGLYSIAIAVPGPGVVAVAGTAMGDWALMSLSAFGLAFLAQSLGKLFLIVKLAGAAYLFYLGYNYWVAEAADTTDIVPADVRGGFLSQLALTLGNPKAIAFFVALLPTVIDLHHLNLSGYFQLCAASYVLIPTITLTYAGLASRVRGFVTSRNARRMINRVPPSSWSVQALA